MVTLRSASSRCRCAVISRRIRATRRVSQIAGGSTTSEISESRQDSATIATAVATAVVRFEAIEVAVEVTTDCMPPMSLVMRDCTSPVRVRVKKAIDWRCRWAKTSVRSRVHDLLADRGADPGLDDAERGGHRGDGDHAEHQPDQQGAGPAAAGRRR